MLLIGDIRLYATSMVYAFIHLFAFVVVSQYQAGMVMSMNPNYFTKLFKFLKEISQSLSKTRVSAIHLRRSISIR